METVPAAAATRATADRCRDGSLVLAIQDTTTPTCTALEARRGLAETGGGGKGSAGILAHAGLGGGRRRGRPPGLFTMEAGPAGTDPDRGQPALAGRPGPRPGAGGGLPGHAGGLRTPTARGDCWRMPGRAAEHGDAPLVRASRSVRQRVRTEGAGPACGSARASLPGPSRRWT